MTSPTPQHARTNAMVRGWWAFRQWRRSRPFWGGLFTILSGLEIFATTQGSLGGLSFQMGPTGFLSWLIPTILVACGLLMWITPAQRLFYAIVAAVTAVFSLIGVNLGGFLIGLLLGMVGSALGFAWTPITPPQPPEPAASSEKPDDGEEEPRPDNETTVDHLLDGHEAPPQRDHWRESDADTTGEIPTQRPGRGRAQLYVITVVLLSLAVIGVVTLRGGTPAHAAPCPPPASPTTPGGTLTPTPSTTPTPAPAEGAKRDEDGNLITDIIEGIGDLIGGGTEQQSPVEAAPTPTPGGTQAPGAEPTPTCPPSGGAPGAEDPAEENKPILTRVVPPPTDITAINRVPSIMTGSKLTNHDLEYHGVTDLPLQGGGTMKVLWFNMTKAVTDDFELKPVVPNNRRMSIKAFPLTVEGNVRFFTPRFTGKLLGLDQVYTPASPPPLIPGVPVPLIPITFTDVEIQLAYVDCNKLTADELLNTP